MELTILQNKTVDKLFEKYNQSIKEIGFSAPTGSGKTIMIAKLISDIFSDAYIRNEKIITIIATPSSAELPKSFETKILKYKKYFSFNDFSVQYYDSPSKNISKAEDIDEIKLEDRKIYIFGKSSFGKKRIYTEFNIINNFIDNAIAEKYKIIYIRDESHIGKVMPADKKDMSHFENLLRENANFIIDMSATLKKEYDKNHKVVLDEKDLLNPEDGKYLLKNAASKKSLSYFELDNDQLLNECLDNFIEIRKEYRRKNLNINPALLIQVNSNTEKLEEDFETNIKKYKEIINKKGLKWVIYFADYKDSNSREIYKNHISLDDISKNDSLIDVIIFKIGPATGWDIPRACMLLQLRNICKESFNIQTVGRIKRNPHPELKNEKPYNKYYIYSNYEPFSKKIIRYKVKEKFAKIRFPLGTIMVNKKIQKDLNTKFNSEINNFLHINKIKILQGYNNYLSPKVYWNTTVLNNKNEKYTIHSYEIKNELRLFMKIDEEKKKHSKILNRIEETIDNFCNKNKLSLIRFYYMVFQSNDIFSLKIIKDIFNKLVHEFDTYKYKIYEKSVELKDYSIYQDKNNKNDIELIYNYDKYGYKNITAKNDNIQSLDSHTENISILKIQKALQKYKNDNKINIWFKNPVFDGLYLEYIDDRTNSIRQNYFDFYLGFNHYKIYMEIKSGEKDYDEEKTKLLIKNYKKYLNNTNQKDIIFILWFQNVIENKNTHLEIISNIDEEKINTFSFEQLLEKLNSL